MQKLVPASHPPGLIQSLLSGLIPAVPSASDGIPYELGTKFVLARSGTIVAIRFWKCSGDSGEHVGRIWSAKGAVLAAERYSQESDRGWQHQVLNAPLQVYADTVYVVTVNVAHTYPFTGGGLSRAIVRGDISSVADGMNGVFGELGTFPTHSINNCNYFRDVAFIADPLMAPERLALVPANAVVELGRACTFIASIQDSAGNRVADSNIAIEFSANGVPGHFSPSLPVPSFGGQASVEFTAAEVGIGAITAAAPGLISATAALRAVTGIGPPRG